MRDDDEHRLMVCPHCMGRNPEFAHVCRFCMTPLSAHASTDPLLSIAARADTLGKAAKAPRKIRLGDVVRATEPDFALVECFAAGNQCIITRSCRLRGILHEGLDAFSAVLDKYTLEDLMLSPKDFRVRPAA